MGFKEEWAILNAEIHRLAVIIVVKRINSREAFRILVSVSKVRALKPIHQTYLKIVRHTGTRSHLADLKRPSKVLDPRRTVEVKIKNTNQIDNAPNNNQKEAN